MTTACRFRETLSRRLGAVTQCTVQILKLVGVARQDRSSRSHRRQESSRWPDDLRQFSPVAPTVRQQPTACPPFLRGGRLRPVPGWCGHREIANGLVGPHERVYDKVCRVQRRLALSDTSVLDFSDPSGRIATSDRYAFSGMPFTMYQVGTCSVGRRSVGLCCAAARSCKSALTPGLSRGFCAEHRRFGRHRQTGSRRVFI